MAGGMVAMVLKGLGVNVTAEDIARLEAIIPQIIPKMAETLSFINTQAEWFHAQLEALKLDRESDFVARVEQHNEVMRTLGEFADSVMVQNAALTKQLERIEENGRSTGSASDNFEPLNGTAKFVKRKRS